MFTVTSFPKRVLLAVSALLIITATVFAGEGRGSRGEGGIQALSAVSAKGAVLTLRLADGTTVDVPRASIKIVAGGQSDVAAADGRAARKRRPSVDDLVAQSASGSLPATVMLRYDRDGYVKRARVNLFRTTAEASAFVEKGRRNREERAGQHRH